MHTRTQEQIQRSAYYGHWYAFIDSGGVKQSAVRSEVLQSWKRCLNYGVLHQGHGMSHSIQGEMLKTALEIKSQLIRVAQPFMADLYALVKGTGFVVALTCERGYILEVFCDKHSSRSSLTSNFFIGASWHEEHAGTNAIGVALVEQKPFQVTGAEHYCERYHPLTCSAAPIVDPAGNLIGTLDISGACEHAHAHTLGMVVAAAKAITAQLRITKKNNQLALANKKLLSFFNIVSDGVLVLDQYGRIAELNPAAEKFFKQQRTHLIGRQIHDLLAGDMGSKEINRFFTDQEPCSDIELALQTSAGPFQCLASIEPLVNEQDTFTGSFITLRPIKTVKNLVNRFSGYSASLQFDDIIGNSPEMIEVVDLAKLSAKSSSNVLLQGESGTGKEIFAQAIHNRSSRSSAPFIPLNCGAIPRELVGSELFGYEDGAFTGARKGGKPGKFELASGGTLFLDEIGDMPFEQQAVLLRVIQEKRMSRIGGLKVIPVDVRLICATHKNLLEKVRNGTFRQDLYYRLNVMSITIPPLRERTQDIPQLFAHFLERLGRDRGAKLRVDKDIMRFLYTYPWPGNVRELQNVVERAANLTVNGVVGSSQLPSEITGRSTNYGEMSVSPPQASLQGRRMEKKEREKEQILHMITICDGNISRVARELGISRKTVYNRMHRHGIPSR